MDFNWNIESNLFNIDEIKNRVNADKLFVSLLLEITKRGFDIHKEFSLSEIADLIPIGTAGINKHSTYGFSIMSMLSGQKDRDYFIFRNLSLRDEFTNICNNNFNRDNYLWKKLYIDEKLRINPKYLRKKDYIFSIDQLIDKDTNYDLYVLSMSIALADITRVLQNIERVMEYPDGLGDITFFHKIGLGFMRESYGLLEEMFRQNRERLTQITSASELFEEITNMVMGNSQYTIFKEYPINNIRNIIFHYMKKNKDFDIMKEAINEMQKEKHKLKYSESLNISERCFEFAENIQINLLFDTYKLSNDDVSIFIDRMTDVRLLLQKIIELMYIILNDFIKTKGLEPI